MKAKFDRGLLMAVCAASALGLAACGAGAGGNKPELADVEDCPINGIGLNDTSEVLHCRCTPSRVGIGVVFGSGPYLDGSSICRAAAHAGVVDDTADAVISVTPVDPEGLEFKESEANGIKAGEYISSTPAEGAFNVE